MDQETAMTMSLPRCGVRDKVGYASDSRSKRYALQGTEVGRIQCDSFTTFLTMYIFTPSPDSWSHRNYWCEWWM